MGSFWTTVLVVLGLIALYLVVVYSGGSTALINAIGSTTANETKILQGR